MLVCMKKWERNSVALFTASECSFCVEFLSYDRPTQQPLCLKRTQTQPMWVEGWETQDALPPGRVQWLCGLQWFEEQMWETSALVVENVIAFPLISVSFTISILFNNNAVSRFVISNRTSWFSVCLFSVSLRAQFWADASCVPRCDMKFGRPHKTTQNCTSSPSQNPSQRISEKMISCTCLLVSQTISWANPPRRLHH